MWKVKRAGYYEWEDCETIADVLEEIEFYLNQNVICDIIIRKEGTRDGVETNPRVPKEAGVPREASGAAEGSAR